MTKGTVETRPLGQGTQITPGPSTVEGVLEAARGQMTEGVIGSMTVSEKSVKKPEGRGKESEGFVPFTRSMVINEPGMGSIRVCIDELVIR